MSYTIKKVSQKLDMTAHTIRHYTDNGLVPNLKHDKNGNRIFDDDSLKWLTAVRFLRNSGMAIEEIREYFKLCLQGYSTFEERYKILIRLKEKADADLEQAKYRAACITDKVEHCKDILAGKVPDDCNPMNW